MSGKISVIIPVYNVKEYLNQCVESVCAQSYESLEIILVNDGSTDGSDKMCDELAGTDERITVVHQENGGLSAARNTGLLKATGEYITFLDSDDYIHPKTYESMMEQLQKYDADVAASGFQVVYDSEENTLTGTDEALCVTGREAVLKLYRSKEEYLVTVVAWNKLYRKSALPKDFSFPKGRIHEDEYTSYRLLYPLSKVVYLNQNYYYYRQRKDSIMHTDFSLKRLDALPAMKEAVDYFEKQNDIFLMKEAVKRYLNNLMTMYDTVKRELSEEQTALQSLKEQYIQSYEKYKDTIKQIPLRRRLLYHWFLHNRPLYCLIVKMRA